MKHRDPRLDTYLARSAPFARPILAHLRRLVHTAYPEARETLKWGAPSFLHGERILCFMAAFKAHCTFGFWHRAMERELGDLAKTGEAMGHLGRLTSLADLPADQTLLRCIRRAVELYDQGVPSAPARSRSPAREAAVPADLAAALRKHASAAATFKAFPPSRRREYIEWLLEAKRPATRARRLATTLDWLAQGKRRNWKYAAC